LLYTKLANKSQQIILNKLHPGSIYLPLLASWLIEDFFVFIITVCVLNILDANYAFYELVKNDI